MDGDKVQKTRGRRPLTEAYRNYVRDFMVDWYARVKIRSGLNQEELEEVLLLNRRNYTADGGRNLRRQLRGQVPRPDTLTAMQTVAREKGWIEALIGMSQILTPTEFQEWQRREFEDEERFNERAVAMTKHEAWLWSAEHAAELERQAAELLRQAAAIRRHQARLRQATAF